jgi:trehalose 6-phosphate synthase/phosphatase
MSKTIIVSNRLPLSITEENNETVVKPSVGGLATGMKAFHGNNDESLWIGWPGINTTEKAQKEKIAKYLKKEQCVPVFLEQELFDDYYSGFSNRTIWPLFHYFTEYTQFDKNFWQAFTEVNKRFSDAVIAHAGEKDVVWIHDYQLMLLPKMLREHFPDMRIGFFLHIPFPSFEILRILPWREQIVEGILGADLVGFHTYDYARHFISCVRRLLGFEVEFNKIKIGKRNVVTDVFPMSIDFDSFNDTSIKIQSKPIQEKSKEHQDLDRFLLASPDRKLILSIDRLDYTKGIPNRLIAYERFLLDNPEYLEKVSLILLVVPSRDSVEQYQQLKSEIEELVGRINGEFGTLNWNPVIYFYRSLPFENLIELYSSSDIALLTPLRDGMNLVAKEFIASHVNLRGTLILSEMAGASKELGEAIMVNPNNIEQVSEAIKNALEMPLSDQMSAMDAMRKRIKRYDVHKWAEDFVSSLHRYHEQQKNLIAKKIKEKTAKHIAKEYSEAKSRILFLDYDGTLVGFKALPQNANPGKELYELLDKISGQQNTELVLISGRDKETFNRWFEHKPYTLIAEHGAWKRNEDGIWESRVTSNNDWKKIIYPVLESFVDRTPGSHIEEKNYSLAWHYRSADIELGAIRALELRTDVSSLIMNNNLEILEGNKVIEIKVSGINKGLAALDHLNNRRPGFVIAIGDDWTDEYMFRELPPSAVTIKVGQETSHASYFLDNVNEVIDFLMVLTE